MSAEENTIHGIYTFSQIKEKWLREKVELKLPNGLSSYDTIRRTLGIIDPKVFQRLIINWIEERLDRSGDNGGCDDVPKRNMQEKSSHNVRGKDHAGLADIMKPMTRGMEWIE